jgi:CubicO group peptidase (beta-lactamase class C family)
MDRRSLESGEEDTMDRRRFLEGAALAGGAVLPSAFFAAGDTASLRKPAARQSRSADAARSSSGTTRGGFSAARLARMHAVMAGHVESDEVPGLVTLVRRHGDVHVDALGRQAVGGEPMRRDTIFRIASLTKAITAAATMILV